MIRKCSHGPFRPLPIFQRELMFRSGAVISAPCIDLVSRRGFLRAGGATVGGLTLADLLRGRAEAAGKTRPKSAILIFLSGAPSHLDMYDMKPQAPVEYRGEFSPIQSNVSGIEVCELMPRQAQIADKFTILRGFQGGHLHTGNEFFSGYPW